MALDAFSEWHIPLELKKEFLEKRAKKSSLPETLEVQISLHRRDLFEVWWSEDEDKQLSSLSTTT